MKIKYFFFLALSITFSSSVFASDKEASVDMLVGACVACHGNNGNSEGPAIPTIAGMTANYFIGAMLSYKFIDDLSKACLLYTSDAADEV